MRTARHGSTVGYVIVRESLSAPLIRSQVVDVLTELLASEGEAPTIVWLYRLDTRLRNKAGFAAAKRYIASTGLRLCAIPFIGGRLPSDWWQIPLVLPQWILGLLYACKVLKLRALHCRSYHAALAGAGHYQITAVPYVFDPRSPMPEETVAAGIWTTSELSLRIWKALERSICVTAHTVISPSSAMAARFQAISTRARHVVIPNNYPRVFSTAMAAQVDSKLESPSQSLRFVYSGSLGHWNQPRPYLEFLSRIHEYIPNSRLLFLVEDSSLAQAMEAVDEYKRLKPLIDVQSTRQEAVFEYLAECDLGLQLMRHRDERLSVKVVEYLAAGLPFITSTNVLGAAEVAKRYEVGFVLDDKWANLDEVPLFIRHVATNRQEWRHRCAAIARSTFSPGAIARQLVDIYQEIAPTREGS